MRTNLDWDNITSFLEKTLSLYIVYNAMSKKIEIRGNDRISSVFVAKSTGKKRKKFVI